MNREAVLYLWGELGRHIVDREDAVEMVNIVVTELVLVDGMESITALADKIKTELQAGMTGDRH